MAFYTAMRHRVVAEPERWPALTQLVAYASTMMSAPGSWAFVMADLRSYLVSELGVADDEALTSVLRAQHALLPTYGRRFPQEVALEHDVVTWLTAVLAHKEAGFARSWAGEVAPLRTYGPATFEVDDPDGVCRMSIGMDREMHSMGFSWELQSPLARARIRSGQLFDMLRDLLGVDVEVEGGTDTGAASTESPVALRGFART
jgi:hypothetical protein